MKVYCERSLQLLPSPRGPRVTLNRYIYIYIDTMILSTRINSTTRKMYFNSGRITLYHDTIAVFEALYHRPS